MNTNHYDEICAILFKNGRRDLIDKLNKTTGAQMSYEIQNLKEILAEKNDRLKIIEKLVILARTWWKEPCFTNTAKLAEYIENFIIEGESND